MREKNDETQGFALLTTFSIVGLVVAGAVGFGTMRSHGPLLGSSDGPAVVSALADAGSPRVYFEVAEASLPADASDALSKVADATRSDTAVNVHIVAFHDASGDAGANAELARRRAWRVHHALESNGVPPQQLVMGEMVATPAGVDPKEARRVEMRLR